MKTVAFLLFALAALTVLPGASAKVQVCDRDPCVDQGVTAGESGVNGHVTVFLAGGFGVGAHAGTDSIYVAYGVGITNCKYGVDIENGMPIARCVF